MKEFDEAWMKSYFEKLQIEVIRTGYSKVNPQRWRNLNVAPNFNCMYYILEGGGWFQIQGKSYEPEAGELIILPVGVVHSYSTSTTEAYRKYWCHFNAKVGDLHLFQLIDLPYCIRIADPEHMRSLFDRLHTSARMDDFKSPLQTKSIMFDILANVFDQNLSQPMRLSASRSVSKLNEILKYIDSHLHEELNVEQLAEAFNYNPKYFIRFFKSKLQLPPMHYINKTRLEYAKRLLMTTDMSVSQISAAVGFEVQYFSKIFKKLNNLTPSKFRSLGRME
jgi:AraC family transcriptional regulator, arabinose operon regulatory protein